MLQSHDLFKFLLIATVLVCVHTYSTSIAGNGSPGGRRARLRDIYNSQVGVRERTEANDGPEVEAYLRYTGLGKGSPWCAAFVCWCLGKAGIPNPQSAWSPALFPKSKIIWQRDRNFATRISGQNKPPPGTGDVFGLFFPEKGRIAHCGFIDTWEEKWVVTVEGNTNEGGSREGDGVYRKRRLQQQLYCVAAYLEEGE